MTNAVKQRQIFRDLVRYFLAHPSYGAGVRAMLISTTAQEDVCGSSEPEIGRGQEPLKR